MSTESIEGPHVDEGAPPAPPPEATLAVAVAVAEDAARASLTVTLDPPEGVRRYGDVADAMPRVAAALAGAGVVHGIDDAAIGAALTAADGAPHPVALATPPGAPEDARIVPVHAEQLRTDPLFTVPARTVIARRTPPRPGTPGIDVLGRPIEPTAPKVPELVPGSGAIANPLPDGTLEIHSAEDGRPVLAGAKAGIETTVRTAEVHPAIALTVHGTLVVHGDVGDGAHITTSGSLIVGGLVSHARLEGEEGVAVAGSMVGARVRAGAHQAACRRVLEPLGTAVEQIGLLDAAADQLIAGSAGAAHPIHETAALRVLVERRFTELPAQWDAAVRVLRTDGAEARVDAAGITAAERLAEALGGVLIGGLVTRGDIARAREVLEPDIVRLTAAAAGSAEVRAAYLQACHVEASGDLTITGNGTYNSDAVVGGDLVADAHGATVRGGDFHVGGVVRVGELGAPGEARVAVALTGPPRPGVRLTAAVAHAGVEIVLAGREIRIEHTTLNLSLGCDEDNGVVRTGEPAG